MIHASRYRPRAYSYAGDVDQAEIDRLQDMSGTITLNRTKIQEIGRVGIVDWQAATPEVTLTQRQFEYGSLEYWNILSNKAIASNESVLMTDFATSRVDIAGYKTDDNDTFLGTVWYPKFRVTGFSLNIGDPNATIERSINLVGENEKQLLFTNKYLIMAKDENASGASHTIVISESGNGFHDYPAPVLDPDNSGQYILRVTRYRPSAGTTVDLTYDATPSTDEYSYTDGTHTVTLGADSASGDIYYVWYSAGTYISGVDPFTDNDTDAASITAENAVIYLGSSNRLYRLQSVAIDVTFDRQDVYEIGNEEVVATGIRDTVVRATLGRILEDHSLEEILRGEAGNDYALIDVNQFVSNLVLIVKIYNNSDHDTFLIGYKLKDLAPTGLDATVPVAEYIQRGATIEGEEGLICDNETTLDAWT